MLRRPAPAHLDRARGGAGAEFRRAGRADLSARHAVPGADGRPVARTAAQARPDLHVHLPRSARGGLARQPSDRDASWQGGGGGARRGALQEPKERLHPRAVRGRVPDRGRAGAIVRTVIPAKAGIQYAAAPRLLTFVSEYWI